MRHALRRLESLEASMQHGGHHDAASEAERRAALEQQQRKIAQLSPYKQAEYYCLSSVAALRMALRQIEAIEAGENSSRPPAPTSTTTPTALSSSTGQAAVPREGSGFDEDHDDDSTATAEQTGLLHGTAAASQQQDLARWRQEARRAYFQLQRHQQDGARLLSRAAPASSGASSVSQQAAASLQAMDWARVVDHVELAKTWYRRTLSIQVSSSLDAAAPGSYRDTTAVGVDVLGHSASLSLPDPLTAARSGREDAEFAAFFESVQANDELIDAALDRITTGVGRLFNNAVEVKAELQVQERLLDETGARIDRNDAALQSMNHRLHRAMEELNDSSVCAYVLCLLLLLLLLCVLLRLLE